MTRPWIAEFSRLHFNLVITPGGYGDLSEPSEQHSRGQTDESYNGSLKKVQFSHQHIGGLCTLRDLLHEVQVHLRSFAQFWIPLLFPLSHTHTSGQTFGVLPNKHVRFHCCSLGGTMVSVTVAFCSPYSGPPACCPVRHHS